MKQANNPYTNPIDRAIFRMRGFILFLLILAGPIFLFSYGWMIRELYYAAPGWITTIAALSHFCVWLGIGTLFDKSQEQDRQ